MRDETLALLRKLMKGKNALSEAEMLLFLEDVRRTAAGDIVAMIKPPAKKAVRAKAPVPEWLGQLEASRKALKWSAAESTHELIQVALDEGLVVSNPYQGKKLPGFGVAAKKIASLSDGEALALSFSLRIARKVADNALG